MTDPKNIIAQIAEADAEVELSARDLLALSDARPVNQSEPDLAARSSGSIADARAIPAPPNTRPAQMDAAKAPPHRHAFRARFGLSFAFVIGILGALYRLVPSNDVNPSSTATVMEHASVARRPAAEQTAAPEPVRFVNPFDGSEVFEFPPGTSDADARDGVAELLMQRATERQR